MPHFDELTIGKVGDLDDLLADEKDTVAVWGRFYDIYHPRLHRYSLRRFSFSDSQADDIANDTIGDWYLRYRSSKFDRTTVIWPYIVVICRNKAVTLIRNSSKTDWLEEIEGPGPSVCLPWDELCFEFCLGRLRKECRQLLVGWFERKSLVELAKCSGMPRGTVGLRLGEARKAMLRCLQSGTETFTDAQ